MIRLKLNRFGQVGKKKLISVSQDAQIMTISIN